MKSKSYLHQAVRLETYGRAVPRASKLWRDPIERVTKPNGIDSAL